MNTSYVQGQTVQHGGEIKVNMLTANGPTSYAAAGDVVYNPGACDYIEFPMDCTTQSGNYSVRFVPTTAGTLRAGAPSPSQSGWTAIWNYAGTANAPAVGVPLTLGTLSAAATQSTYTANGVMTVLTTTPPPAGSFILLTNGASAAGIFLNGNIVYVTSSVAGVSYTFNYAPSKSLNYTIATDTLKWQRVYGGGTNNPVALGTGTGQSVAVSSVAVASNVLTVVCAGLVPVGTIGVMQGLVAGEVPQGGICQVLTSSVTGFTANLIAPNLGATSLETGTFTTLVTNGNAPIQANQDAFGINGSTVASTAATSSAAGLVSVLPVLQTLVPGNIVIIQGLTHGAALNGLITPVITTGLTATNVELNGFTITSVTTGTGDLGAIGLLMTGTPINGPQVASGTNLSAEVVQFGAFVSQL